ncbi:MAG TPA: hypothetical protein DHD79_12355 [Firmicutes bacterium]|jgi:hypothetical protein|nr:hypothetical protein [Bacillota bacterium]HAW70682.1 hypothetical protein [Bacillota bacterium]HAZ21741.1 hypothetical protein [Bacillota bacterium]HBG42913.1 hypothetical protein [Bacillota bacterium]HBR23826.1 hypothetical protein [Bacillota bacterium]
MEIRAVLPRLQQIDHQLAGFLLKLQSIGQPCADLKDSLQEKSHELSEREHQLKKTQSEIKRLELEAASFADQIKTCEQRLYSGTAGARELSQLEQRLTELRRHEFDTEDEILDLMVRLETERTKYDLVAGAVAHFQEELAIAEHQEAEERCTLEKNIAELNNERQKAVAELGTEWEARYERLKVSGHGTAIASLVNGCCSVCRVSLPEDFVRRVSQGGEQLHHCEHCGRLLL